MDAYEIIKLVCFFAGMLISFLLVVQLLNRKRKTKSGVTFFFLMLSAGLWNFGNFTTYFLDNLFKETTGDIIFINKAFSIFAVIGLTFIPSLLLHTLVSIFFEKELNFHKSLQRWIERSIYIIYFPVLFVPLMIFQLFMNPNPSDPYNEVLKNYIFPFNIWLSSILIMAGFICLKLSSVGWEKEERSLFFVVSWVFFIIAAGIGFHFLLEDKNIIVEYTQYLILTASLLPTIILTYYIYRYNYLDFVIRRGILYSLLITTIVLLYLFGVQALTDFIGDRFALRSSMLESLFILALVFAFRPFRTQTAVVLDRFFFKEREIYKGVYRDLTQQLRGGRVRDMPILLRHIVESLKKTMELEHASLLFFEEEGDSYRITASTLPFKVSDLTQILEYIESQKLKVLNQTEVEVEEVLREMENAGASTIIPIYAEQELLGLLILGKKASNRRIHSEELDMLLLLASQLTTEIQNMHLVEEKVKLEREMVKNEKFMALGRLSASVAHQVKNPLSSIKIITQVLREDLEPGDPREEDLTLIINEVNKLTRVVNQLLEFAKPVKSKAVVESNLAQVVDEVVILMQYEANQSKIKIEKDIQKELPLLLANRMTLQDIFSNLVQNSIQAMEKKEGGQISIKSYYPSLSFQENGKPISTENCLTLEIRDEGDGISPENLENIFEPFYTTKQQGTGLGLPIVKQRINNIGGHITVRSCHEENSELSSGTAVLLWLPVVQPPPPVEEEIKDTEEEKAPDKLDKDKKATSKTKIKIEKESVNIQKEKSYNIEKEFEKQKKEGKEKKEKTKRRKQKEKNKSKKKSQKQKKKRD